eukprot:g39246.t1
MYHRDNVGMHLENMPTVPSGYFGLQNGKKNAGIVIMVEDCEICEEINMRKRRFDEDNQIDVVHICFSKVFDKAPHEQSGHK